MITYNHEDFISQAIEGVMMQETDFDFELVIGEDRSSDKTREIVLSYKEKYPEKIRLLLPDENLGVFVNFRQTLQACDGKYIALCDGDDYWIDKLKLQKQVDFFGLIDIHKEYSICFHDSIVVDEIGSKVHNSIIGCFNEDYSVDDVILGKAIPTQSVMFRSEFLDIRDLNISSKSLDSLLFTLLIQKGKARHLTNIRKSVYRIHNGGIWSSLKIRLKYIESLNYQLELYTLLDKKLQKLVIQRVYEISRQVNHSGISLFDKVYIKLICIKILLSKMALGKSMLVFKRILQ